MHVDIIVGCAKAYTGQETDPDCGASHLEKTQGVGGGLVDNGGIRG